MHKSHIDLNSIRFTLPLYWAILWICMAKSFTYYYIHCIYLFAFYPENMIFNFDTYINQHEWMNRTRRERRENQWLIFIHVPIHISKEFVFIGCDDQIELNPKVAIRGTERNGNDGNTKINLPKTKQSDQTMSLQKASSNMNKTMIKGDEKGGRQAEWIKDERRKCKM